MRNIGNRISYSGVRPGRMFVLVLLALTLTATPAAGGQFAKLQQRLVRDGFDAGTLQQLYSHRQAQFDTQGVSLFFIHREARLNYDQFTSRKAIGKASKYMQVHGAPLKRAQETYGVAAEIITAVLLVETRLGTYLGNRYVFNTLSTMAALADPEVRETFWRNIPRSVRLGRKAFEKKADQKSRWAYDELKAFLAFTRREGLEPIGVTGSYAGAMGISQFMPSNALKLASDGNGDGRTDLFDHDDAIFSVANYLKHHGWRPDQNAKQAYKVLLRYNYSRPYANTILKVAGLLAENR